MKTEFFILIKHQPVLNIWKFFLDRMKNLLAVCIDLINFLKICAFQPADISRRILTDLCKGIFMHCRIDHSMVFLYEGSDILLQFFFLHFGCIRTDHDSIVSIRFLFHPLLKLALQCLPLFIWNLFGHAKTFIVSCKYRIRST